MTDFEQRYVAARKAVIARDLARLNPMQRQGAMTTEGPLLLLAGAGSGKTTVLIQRVYNLLTYGRGSDSDEVPTGPRRRIWAFWSTSRIGQTVTRFAGSTGSVPWTPPGHGRSSPSPSPIRRREN